VRNLTSPLFFGELTSNSKKLQFSLLNAQDTVKISEFEVTHRDLYTATDRLPVKNGVLDRRLVSYLRYELEYPASPYFISRELQKRVLSVKPVDNLLSIVLVIMHTSNLLSLYFISVILNIPLLCSRQSARSVALLQPLRRP
jgi:hypothetical protein